MVGLTFSKAFVEHTQKDGKLNNNTVIRYQAMLSSIFKKGVQWGLINENPCSRAEHPKAEEIDVRVLTEEEIPKLLDALSDAPPQYSVITQLALLLGAGGVRSAPCAGLTLTLRRERFPSSGRSSPSPGYALCSMHRKPDEARDACA